MNKCIIYDEERRAQFAHYKSLSEKRGKQLNHGKLYSVPTDKRNIEFQMVEDQVWEGLLLLSSATGVMVQDITQMNVKVMKRNA